MSRTGQTYSRPPLVKHSTLTLAEINAAPSPVSDRNLLALLNVASYLNLQGQVPGSAWTKTFARALPDPVQPKDVSRASQCFAENSQPLAKSAQV